MSDKKEKNQKKIGRPGRNWTELQSEICERISTSNKSIRTILKELEAELGYTADYSTVKDWLRADADFAAQYARAKDEQADYLAEEMLEIADATSSNMVDVNNRRLQIDTRKWIAAKLKPKKYGDKLEVGSNDGKPVEILVVYEDKKHVPEGE